ncbi:molybdenum cofactor biosynthesis protein MoaE [bacterium]|nr:molybdenum cofactor biosynthesis protein MoaE [bacterium]
MIQESNIFIDISDEPVDVTKLYQFVVCKEAGAVDLFVGTVRNEFEGRPVNGIEYHGFPEMAERLLSDICKKAMAEWGIQKVAIQHRIGYLQLTEASVIVAVSSAHRHEAFTACRFIMEEVKSKIPVWKKEYFADGFAEWKNDVNQPKKS